MSEKLVIIGVFNSNFELKVQNKGSHFPFLLSFLIHIDTTFKYTK